MLQVTVKYIPYNEMQQNAAIHKLHFIQAEMSWVNSVIIEIILNFILSQFTAIN
jgi:hypothetical protein